MNAWKRILRNTSVTVAAFLVGMLPMSWLITEVLVGDPTPAKSVIFAVAALLGAVGVAAAFKFLGHRDLAVFAATWTVALLLIDSLSALVAIPTAVAIGTYGLLTRKRRARIAKLRARQHEVRAAQFKRMWAPVRERERVARVIVQLEAMDTQQRRERAELERRIALYLPNYQLESGPDGYKLVPAAPAESRDGGAS